MRAFLRAIRVLATLALLLAPTFALQGPPRQPNRAEAPRQDSSSVAQRVDEGRVAMRNQDYGAAMQILAPLAEQGVPDAQCLVALMHQKGYGVTENKREALRWYTLAALQGHSDAEFMLGQMYYNGDGIARDLGKGADLFLLNAVTGDADGQWAFGMCVTYGEGRDEDPIEGYAWLYMATQQGQADARKELEGSRLGKEDRDIAVSLAAQFQDMVVNDGFDRAKLPRVPVPEGMDLNTQAAPDQGGPAGSVEAEMNIVAELLPTGDLRGTAQVVFPPAFYQELQKLVPDPRLFLRDIKSSRSNQEVAPDATARYDDAASAVILDLHMLGAVFNRGDGQWEWETDNHVFEEMSVDDQGRHVAAFGFALDMEDEGLVLRGRAVYRLPADARDPRWDEGKRTLAYHLPYTGPTGRGRCKVKFDVRDRIMSCLYKVYGLEDGFAAQWVAKAVFTNVGDGPLTDLKVRFRLGEYSELDLWQKFPEVIPGQTAVAVYHPVLRKTIAELSSTTPANLIAEWKWTDAEGKEHEDSDGGRISILGRHEFIFSNLTESESTGSYFDAFSNAEFVAAWVTRDDPVVKQFAAAANKAAGGAGACYSDEAAWKVLKACYEIWQANDFTYQGPVGLVDASLSFDNKIVQSMKFPRDVIRDRSGTCIELTALYCAMAHAVGLESYMILIPGHAFPLIQLPSGNFLPVECTGVGGGKKYGSTSFDDVVQIAKQNFEKHAAEGTLIEVDIDDAWLSGIANPELEAVPADILQRWNTVLEFTLSPDDGGPDNDPRATTDGSAYVGRWSGTATQPIPGGQSLPWTMELTIAAGPNGTLQATSYGEARIPNGWGSDLYRFDQSLEGQVQSGRLELRGTSKTLTINGQPQRLPTDTMVLQLQGGRLIGHVQLPDGTRVTVDAQRRQ